MKRFFIRTGCVLCAFSLLLAGCSSGQAKPTDKVTSAESDSAIVLSSTAESEQDASITSGNSSTVVPMSSASSKNTTSHTSSSGKESSVMNTSKAETTASEISEQTSSSASTASKEPVMPQSSHVSYIGRFATGSDGEKVFSWSNSTIVLGFTGTRLRVSFDTTELTYLNVSVDGNEPTVLALVQGKKYYTVASYLPAGKHTVTLVKRATPGTVSFYGVDYSGGKSASVPARSDRRIEVIGDSITAGYGIESLKPSEHYNVRQENATITYGALAAKQLNAEATIIATSGDGIVQWCDGRRDELIPERYRRTISEDKNSVYDFKGGAPQVVVINAGTNDFACVNPRVNPSEYVSKYVDFIQFIHQKYPDAVIIAAMGTMLYSAWDSVVEAVDTAKAAGIKNVYALRFDAPLASDGLGQDSHPSAATHQKMAKQLADEISRLMNWK